MAHVDYIATEVYHTLMSGRFDPISVNYFDRTSLSNFRTSMTCLGIWKTGLSLNDLLYTLIM